MRLGVFIKRDTASLCLSSLGTRTQWNGRVSTHSEKVAIYKPGRSLNQKLILLDL